MYIYIYNHLWQFHGWFTAGCLKLLSQNSHVTHRIGHFLYPKLGCCLPRFAHLRIATKLAVFWKAISNKNKSLQIIYVIFWMVILEPLLLPRSQMAILSSSEFYQITLDPTNLRYPCKHPWIFDELNRPPMAAKHRSFPRRRFPQGPLPFEGEGSQVLWAPAAEKWHETGRRTGQKWCQVYPLVMSK